MAPLRWLMAAAVASLSVAPLVAADNATINWMEDLPAWQQSAVMRLQLTAPASEAAPLTYDVYPLTRRTGLNGTEVERKVRRSASQSSLGSQVLTDGVFHRLSKSRATLCSSRRATTTD